MPEPSLAVAFKDLTGDVGFFLGYGRGADNGATAWTTDQQAAIDRCVKGGLRRFYHCGYEWSFLKPVATLGIASGGQVVDLPDDYGGADGQIMLTVSGGTQWGPLDFGGVGRVYQQHAASPTTTGRPVVCCEEPLRGTGATQGQRFQLRFWPLADQAYTIRLRYFINPDYLSGALPYAYGGAEHAETLLEACLAVAETILDDQRSIHEQKFKELMEISVAMDRRRKPQLLGYNGDRSEGTAVFARDHWSNPVLVNGVAY